MVRRPILGSGESLQRTKIVAHTKGMKALGILLSKTLLAVTLITVLAYKRDEVP